MEISQNNLRDCNAIKKQPKKRARIWYCKASFTWYDCECDNFYITVAVSIRLHSSRMHIARLLTVYPCMHCAGGMPGPGGCLLSEGGYLLRGVVSQHALRQTPPPPWTEFLTHATENITFPQTSFAGGNKCAQNPFIVMPIAMLSPWHHVKMYTEYHPTHL